jgi:hypothetical protein
MANSTESAEMQMQLALEACREVSDPNFRAIARQFLPVNRQTLKICFHGEQDLRALANSICRQNLTIEQEEQLSSHINILTNQGLPPTSLIVRNLAEEMIERPIGKKK